MPRKYIISGLMVTLILIISISIFASYFGHYWSPLYHYWQHFDCDRVLITQWILTNDGAGYGRGIRYTKNNETPHFSQISDEEKSCGTVGSAHAVSCAKTTLYGTVSETFDALWKGRNCIFATNNRYLWNLGVSSFYQFLNWNVRAGFEREKIHQGSKNFNAKLQKWNKWW